jgi:ribosomal protection tetracycline resistance protein
VRPLHDDDREQLRVALAQLAEQDPLIDVKQDDSRHELSVSLYGEVQGQVLQATLADEYGIDVSFREPTPICVERPLGAGEAVEILHAETNPHMATIGLRIEPAPEDAGIELRLDVHPTTVPLYVYKRFERFEEAMNEYVREALTEGLFGWHVTDCLVTMTRCMYAIPDGPPSRRGRSTSADFRKLTPLVLRQALEQAGTAVCEPILHLNVEAPADAVAAVLSTLAKLGAVAEPPSVDGRVATVEATLPVAQTPALQRRLPQLTHGEGVVESSFAGYRPVTGASPRRS